jgi:hypothetical protein
MKAPVQFNNQFLGWYLDLSPLEYKVWALNILSWSSVRKVEKRVDSMVFWVYHHVLWRESDVPETKQEINRNIWKAELTNHTL